ncbi:Hypothetical predicted protein [Xyrichtys novacula]|uniref:Uncharacterized protein n=1 Tax=Xyrichtys novacula TaxID=13765 RepID=A0AAV1FR44_XYRNO|nr:Hypothetical predicted protein [Xyrichtys novacula]
MDSSFKLTQPSSSSSLSGLQSVMGGVTSKLKHRPPSSTIQPPCLVVLTLGSSFESLPRLFHEVQEDLWNGHFGLKDFCAVCTHSLWSDVTVRYSSVKLNLCIDCVYMCLPTLDG